MGEVQWTMDLTIRLVHEYRNRPMLWDVNHTSYRVHTAKYEAYAQLAAMFGCDVVDLRKKLNSVFASHRREKVKIRGGARSNWFLYPYLSFLPSHIDQPDDEVIRKTSPKTSESYYEEEHLEDNVDETYEVSNLDNDITIKEEMVSHTPVKVKRARQDCHKPRLVRRPVRKQVTTSQLDSRLVEAVKLLRRSELTKKKDECDSFGEYIAVSLRKHDERTQSMIKQAINNILFEQEMKKYNSNQYVVIHGMDENPLILSDSENAEK